MQDADLGRVRHQGTDQLQLGLHGQGVGGAGDLAGVGAVGVGQLGSDGIGHGGVDHRDALFLSHVVGSLGHWGSHGADQVAVSSHLVGDLRGNAGVSLSVLVIKNDVLAFHIAGCGKALDEALTAVVQGGMLGELDDADLDGRIVRLGDSGKGEDKCQRQQQGSQLLQVLHNQIPSFLDDAWVKFGIKKRPNLPMVD